MNAEFIPNAQSTYFIESEKYLPNNEAGIQSTSKSEGIIDTSKHGNS